MEIINKKLEELKPYENNPRFNDEAVEYVANSIKQFGFKVPIIIDKNNVIVAGHTRYKASIELGLEEVPCIVADDLTEEQIKAYRLADNKVSEQASWNFELLGEELEDILNIDMENFGFDEIEIDDIEEEKEIIEDEVPEVPEEPKAKLGDIYQLGNHKLMCGDSTSIDDVNKLMNGVKAELLLTDPPYGVDIIKNSPRLAGDKIVPNKGNIGGSVLAKTRNYSAIIGDDTTDTAKKSYLVLKQYTQNQILFGGNYFTDFLEPKACWIVWDKQNGETTFADCELAWTSFDKSAKLYSWLWSGMRRKGDRQSELKDRVHPTQKPVGMLAEILKDFSNENEIIVDVFGGSGSTLIACEQLNRKCYMMELDPHYIDVIIQRWENFTGQKAVKIEGEE